MKKIRALLGLPVFDLSTGKQIGEVKDVVMDLGNCYLIGILMCHAGWFHCGKGIRTPDIKSFGEDIITIDSAVAIIDAKTLDPDEMTVLTSEIIGKHIVTDEGKTVGTLSDVFFDSGTGALTGYEVSDSVILDLLEGRSVLSLPMAQQFGKDAIIVPDAALQVTGTRRG